MSTDFQNPRASARGAVKANQFPLIGGPLLPAGADVARALFPAHGTVKATGCSVTWSNTELAPMVPMDITGGAA